MACRYTIVLLVVLLLGAAPPAPTTATYSLPLLGRWEYLRIERPDNVIKVVNLAYANLTLEFQVGKYRLMRDGQVGIEGSYRLLGVPKTPECRTEAYIRYDNWTYDVMPAYCIIEGDLLKISVERIVPSCWANEGHRIRETRVFRRIHP